MIDNVFEQIGNLANLLGLVSAFFSFIVWLYLKRQEKHQNKLISIKVAVEGTAAKVQLPGKIRRKNLTRAEVLGMLGMLPMNQDKVSNAGKPRFELDYLNDEQFFQVLEQAQVDPKVEEIEIRFSPREIRQYDKMKLTDICKVEGTAALEQVFADDK